MVLTVPPSPFLSSKSSILCGNFHYVCYSDALLTVLETDIFNYDEPTRILSIESYDRSKLLTYPITIKAY